MQSLILLLLILVAMLGILQIFSLLAARASGWRILAEHFSTNGRLKEELLPIPRAEIGTVVYKNGVYASPCSEGLYLQPWILDRLMHKSLLIPWQSISRSQLVEPSFYLLEALSQGNSAAAVLVRLGLKEITNGLHENPQLRNAIFQVECGGELIEIQLLMDGRKIASFLLSGHPKGADQPSRCTNK